MSQRRETLSFLFHRRKSLLLALSGSLLLLWGCSKTDETPSSPEKTPLAAADSKPKQVLVVAPSKTDEQDVETLKGIQQEAKTLGWPEPTVTAPDKADDAEQQIAQATEGLAKKPQAIVVRSASPQALETIIEKANAAQIPVFVYGQTKQVKKGQVTAYIACDEPNAGISCADLTSQQFGEAVAHIALLRGRPGPATEGRLTGFHTFIRRYPNIQIVAEKDARDAASAAKATKEILQQYPDLALVCGSEDVLAQGAAQAAQESGKTLKCIGIGGSKAALQDVKAEKLLATLAYRPQETGKEIVRRIKDHFDGVQRGKIKTIFPLMVTKKNVDEMLK